VCVCVCVCLCRFVSSSPPLVVCAIVYVSLLLQLVFLNSSRSTTQSIIKVPITTLEVYDERRNF